MKLTRPTIVFILIFLVAAGIYVFLFILPPSSSSRNSPANDVTKLLRCNRTTADYAITDPLCTNPEYARQLFSRGITFGINFTDAGEKPTQSVLVVINDGAKIQPLAQTRIKVSTEVQVNCIKAPCNSVEESLTESTTDNLGIISLPAFPPSPQSLITLIIEVDGHPTKRETIAISPAGQYLVRIQ